ncbi:putative Glucose-fructose oxidoreductase domain-containing protein 2 [Quillaja saponaria]|uniref:Glucose-fructose oxidoreductase domain-containing protein 2 n=1 Tax=Quillaja saponaria TaxID=32244 RepID=A0AAD7M213_QUISA|nr:putative Glucose-fructose oxidoreductase domain-containing protein 2 [Quillaja saponaria]
MVMNMGFLGRLEWMNAYSKKHCRSLFWRVRAAVKKAVKNGGKQKIKFQYDPSSYALNFDDGCCHIGDGAKKLFRDAKVQDFPDGNTTTWVYVLWVKTK